MIFYQSWYGKVYSENLESEVSLWHLCNTAVSTFWVLCSTVCSPLKSPALICTPQRCRNIYRTLRSKRPTHYRAGQIGCIQNCPHAMRCSVSFSILVEPILSLPENINSSVVITTYLDMKYAAKHLFRLDLCSLRWDITKRPIWIIYDMRYFMRSSD